MPWWASSHSPAKALANTFRCAQAVSSGGAVDTVGASESFDVTGPLGLASTASAIGPLLSDIKVVTVHFRVLRHR